jgi:hypothetical protein
MHFGFMLHVTICIVSFLLYRFSARPQPSGQMLGHPSHSLLPSAGKDLFCYLVKIAPPFFFFSVVYSVVIRLSFIFRFGFQVSSFGFARYLQLSNAATAKATATNSVDIHSFRVPCCCNFKLLSVAISAIAFFTKSLTRIITFDTHRLPT